LSDPFDPKTRDDAPPPREPEPWPRPPRADPEPPADGPANDAEPPGDTSRPWDEPSRPWDDEPLSDSPRPWQPSPSSAPPTHWPPPEPASQDDPSSWHREPPPWEPSEPPRAPGPPPEPPRRGLNPLVRLGIPQPWRTIIDWIVTIVGAIAIVLAIKAWIVNPYRIPSSSMEPTLHCARPGSLCTARFSDRVLANRFIYRFRDPHRGEIIVFNVPAKAEEACGAGGVFVKRIVGLPGEVWQEKEGFVYINGKKLSEPYIKPERRDFQSYPARKIPAENYFMMGDNRQSSCDSRRWGTVPRANVIGKVFAIYWPPQRIRINP
jgi:signal peptidase I